MSLAEFLSHVAALLNSYGLDNAEWFVHHLIGLIARGL